jgi:hypothetical protein
MTIAEINKQNYEIGRLPALRQFHVVRRLAPLVALAGTPVLTLGRGASNSLEEFTALLAPVIDQLAKMQDDEVDYVIFTCLSVVKRQTSTGGYAAVLAPQGQALMFEDVDMDTMIKLVVAVLKENLSGFFASLGGALTSPSS